MQRGFSDQVIVGDRTYLVQTEDKGLGRKEIAVLVFEGGLLVYRRIVGYADLVELGLSDQQEIIGTAVRNAHQQVRRELSLGLRAKPRASVGAGRRRLTADR
jgi:hypothetical protein